MEVGKKMGDRMSSSKGKLDYIRVEEERVEKEYKDEVENGRDTNEY